MFLQPRKPVVWELRFHFILDRVEEGHAKSWGSLWKTGGKMDP